MARNDCMAMSISFCRADRSEEYVDDVRFCPLQFFPVAESHPPEADGVVLGELLPHVLGIFHTLRHGGMLADGAELTDDERHAQLAGEAPLYAGEDVVNLLLASGVKDIDVPLLGIRVIGIIAEPIGIVTVYRCQDVVGMLVVGNLHSGQFGRRTAGTAGSAAGMVRQRRSFTEAERR